MKTRNDQMIHECEPYAERIEYYRRLGDGQPNLHEYCLRNIEACEAQIAAIIANHQRGN